MPWVWTARLVKPKGPVYPGQQRPRVVVELLELEDPPPGSGFPTRHAAKQHRKRDHAARPSWADECTPAGVEPA